jgi:hypothetical protein
LFVAVNEWRSDFALHDEPLPATTRLFELCDHIFFV